MLVIQASTSLLHAWCAPGTGHASHLPVAKVRVSISVMPHECRGLDLYVTAVCALAVLQIGAAEQQQQQSYNACALGQRGQVCTDKNETYKTKPKTSRRLRSAP